ncbi:MAG: redoxin domain-containing protein [Anaerolineales bacterium]|nr:redoxin domain-containing protein [Anaerolineales bacterium]
MSRVIASKSYRSKPVRSKTWFYLNVALAVGLMAAGVGMLFWLGGQSAARSSAANQGIVQPGQPAPDFSLPALNGETVRLSDLKGQVVLVNLWATWCPPCKAEMPTIDAFYRAHQEAGFTALMANVQEDWGTVRAFIEMNGFTFPVLLDSQGELMRRYGVRGLPTTFIVDRSGQVRHIQTGAITQADLETIINPLLSQ